MSHKLSFSTFHQYDPARDGIEVPIKLISGTHEIDLTAKLDTGASWCIFEREFGEELGLDIEAGLELSFFTANGGRFVAYGHEVKLLALGFELVLTVYFTGHQGFNRNVLGRQGFFQQIGVGIVDYDGRLFAGRYDELTVEQIHGELEP